MPALSSTEKTSQAHRTAQRNRAAVPRCQRNSVGGQTGQAQVTLVVVIEALTSRPTRRYQSVTSRLVPGTGGGGLRCCGCNVTFPSTAPRVSIHGSTTLDGRTLDNVRHSALNPARSR